MAMASLKRHGPAREPIGKRVALDQLEDERASSTRRHCSSSP